MPFGPGGFRVPLRHAVRAKAALRPQVLMAALQADNISLHLAQPRSDQMIGAGLEARKSGPFL